MCACICTLSQQASCGCHSARCQHIVKRAQPIEASPAMCGAAACSSGGKRLPSSSRRHLRMHHSRQHLTSGVVSAPAIATPSAQAAAI